MNEPHKPILFINNSLCTIRWWSLKHMHNFWIRDARQATKNSSVSCLIFISRNLQSFFLFLIKWKYFVLHLSVNHQRKDSNKAYKEFSLTTTNKNKEEVDKKSDLIFQHGFLRIFSFLILSCTMLHMLWEILGLTDHLQSFNVNRALNMQVTGRHF